MKTTDPSRLRKTILSILVIWLVGLLFSGGVSFTQNLALGGEEAWVAYAYKAQHLGADLSEQYSHESHEAKLTSRIAFPLLLKVLHIGRAGLPLYFLIQSLLLVALFYTVIRMHYPSEDFAGMGTLLLVAMPVWGLTTWPATGFSDGMAWILATAVFLRRNWVYRILLMVAAAATDERAVVTIACFTLAFILLEPHPFRILATVKAHFWFIIGLVLYFIYRFLTTKLLAWDVAVSGMSWTHAIETHRAVIPYVLRSFETVWMLVFLTLILVFKKQPTLISATLLMIVALVYISTCIHDLTRSLSFLFPILLIPFSIHQNASWDLPFRQHFKPILLFACAAALLQPNVEIINSSREARYERWISPQWLQCYYDLRHFMSQHPKTPE